MSEEEAPSSYSDKWQVSAHLREQAKGNKPDELEAHPHVGMVADSHVRRYLSHLASHYDPELVADMAGVAVEEVPARFEETQLFREVIENEGTETATRALHGGDAQTQSYLVGDAAARSDISGVHAIQDLRDMLIRAAPIVYIFGPPGSGKTNFGVFMAELWQREHHEGQVATNIRTLEEADDWIPTYGRLSSWLDENLKQLPEGGTTMVEDAPPKLFIFDEASSHASGRGKQGAEAGAKLGPLVYKIRKANAGLIIIGHDGKDVHPAVRTLATVVQKKRGERKKATLFEDVRNREGKGMVMDLTAIPETAWTYDHREATSWDWTEAQSEEQAKEDEVRQLAEEIAQEKEEGYVRTLAHRMATSESNDLSESEIGRILGEATRGKPFSQSWVAKWKKRGEEGLEERDRHALSEKRDEGEP
jgi:hypothetical protein